MATTKEKPPVEDPNATPPVETPPAELEEGVSAETAETAGETPALPEALIDSPSLAAFKEDFDKLLNKPGDETEIKPVAEDTSPTAPLPNAERVATADALPPGTPPVEPPVVPPVETPPAAPAKKAKKIMEIVVPPQPATPHPQPLSPVEAERVAPPAADPDAEYIKGLTDEQRLELEESEHAEKHFGERYKGRRKQLLDYYKNVDRFASEHPTAQPDDEDFQKLLKTKPSLAGADQRRVIREMAETSAVKKARESVDPELAEIKRRQRLVESEPLVQSVADQMKSGVREYLTTEEETLKPIVEAIASKGVAEAEKEFKFKAKIVVEEENHATAAAREYAMLSGFVGEGGQPLKQFDPENKTHQWVNGFIGAQCDYFKANGKEKLVDAQGRRFLTRAEYGEEAKRDPQCAQKYWTFGHEAILKMIGHHARIETMRRIAETEAWMKENGFEAVKPAVSAEPKTSNGEPKPLEAARTRSRPAPGAAVTPKPAAPATGLNAAELMDLKV